MNVGQFVLSLALVWAVPILATVAFVVWSIRKKE